jgi:hypothetical protein
MADVALLAWQDVSWAGFVRGLEGYRDHVTTDRGNRAYADFLALPKGPDHATELVGLLNRWACRLSTTHAPSALAEWMRSHRADLDEVRTLTISDPRVRGHANEIGDLHDELIGHMQAGGVRNMGAAAASKALHLLVPNLSVMWDKEIRRSAPEGYGAYLLEMHVLARRLTDEATADDVEAYLQERLGYGTRKTLAKYLDEYNWFEAVGREQLTAHTDRSRAAPGSCCRRPGRATAR